jgi:hypothetical protein
MPVRGTSEQLHAIIQRKAINLDHGVNGGPTKYIMCAWDDCEKDGFELYKCRVNTGAAGRGKRYITYVFCSERHKQYWVNSTRGYGRLPAGYRLAVG